MWKFGFPEQSDTIFIFGSLGLHYLNCYSSKFHLCCREVVMNSDQRVVELLKRAYHDEIETVMNYMAHSINLDGVRAEEIKEELNADVNEELTHARELGQRLKQLDEAAPASFDFEAHQESLQPTGDSTDVLSVIEGVIDAEKEAIELYRDLISAAQENDDPVTEDIAVGILRDEEEHLTLFKGFRKEYRKDV